jgi:hypothetical protein
MKLPPYFLQIWLHNGTPLSAMFESHEDAELAMAQIHDAQKEIVPVPGGVEVCVPVRFDAANGNFLVQPGSVACCMTGSYDEQSRLRVVQGKQEIDVANRIQDRGPMGIQK